MTATALPLGANASTTVGADSNATAAAHKKTQLFRLAISTIPIIGSKSQPTLAN